MYSKARHYKALFPSLKMWFNKIMAWCKLLELMNDPGPVLATSVPRDLPICDLEQENAVTEDEKKNGLQNRLVEIVLYVYPAGG